METITLIKNFLSKEKCKRYIEFIENKRNETKLQYDKRYGESPVVPELSKELWDILQFVAPEVEKEKAFACSEKIPIVAYEAGTSGTIKHTDKRWRSDERFVCILYLNDVEGGETVLYLNEELSVKPEQGKLLIFPITALHRGMPTESKKYIICPRLRYCRH
jgi:hypothetical protein